MNRMTLVAAMAVVLAACGSLNADDTAVSAPSGDIAVGAAGMCAQDEPDCVDTPQLTSGDPVPVDDTGIKQLRRDAKYYLGRGEDELTEQIRIGRVDNEQFALTEDYRIGRITVELDTPEGEDTPIVTSATVELPEGPETFTLEQ